MDIFVSGSLAFDRIMTFPGKFSDHILPDKLHILNVCFLVDGLDEKFGGTAGNIAYTLSLLGEKSNILSAVGKDFDRYAERLRILGLPSDGIRVVEEEFTAGAYITTDQSDNQITGFNPGAMKHPSLYAFNGVDPAGSVAVIAPGNKEDMQAYAAKYRELGLAYIFDPGQQIPVFSGEEMLEAVAGSAVLVSNDYELEMIMQNTGKTKAQLLELTGAIITTLGEKGSLVCDKDSRTEVAPALVEKAVDPTGAGDAYRAGLIKGLCMGKPLSRAARLGSISAAFCVEHSGTQEHTFTWDEFAARYQATYGENLG